MRSCLGCFLRCWTERADDEPVLVIGHESWRDKTCMHLCVCARKEKKEKVLDRKKEKKKKRRDKCTLSFRGFLLLALRSGVWEGGDARKLKTKKNKRPSIKATG